MKTIKSITITENENGALDVNAEAMEEGQPINQVELVIWLNTVTQKATIKLQEDSRIHLPVGSMPKKMRN